MMRLLEVGTFAHFGGYNDPTTANMVPKLLGYPIS